MGAVMAGLKIAGIGLVLVLAGVASVLAAEVGTAPATAESKPATTTRYSTKFEKDENPLSEKGRWINGKTDGLDWADVCVVKGMAFGTESGHTGYDDTTAVLTGDWPTDQTAQATVKIIKVNAASEEVELRLRTSITPHKCTGYEINFRCGDHNSGYNEIVRWDGPLGKFTYLSQKGGGAADGDVIKATIKGHLIIVYRNGVEVNRAKDDTFKSGNPGIGFFLSNGPEKLNADYGFTSFSAE